MYEVQEHNFELILKIVALRHDDVFYIKDQKNRHPC